MTAPTIQMRMYLREMGSVELFCPAKSEIAIAESIEASRELMIGALWEVR